MFAVSENLVTYGPKQIKHCCTQTMQYINGCLQHYNRAGWSEFIMPYKSRSIIKLHNYSSNTPSCKVISKNTAPKAYHF